MTRRLFRLGFVACTVFTLFWAPLAVGKDNRRTLRGERLAKSSKVLVVENAFTLGAWSGSVRRAKGLVIGESGISEGRDLAFSLSVLPRNIVFDGVRPFVETGVEINALKPQGFARSGGRAGTIERATRWRLGGGLAIPLEFGSYSMSLESTLHYALTASTLSNGASAVDFESKRFTSHAVQLGLGTVIPIGTIGPVRMSVGLAARAHIPVSGSTSAESNLAANTNIEIQGGIGIQAKFAGLLGRHF
jgi:hypothetical protein